VSAAQSPAKFLTIITIVGVVASLGPLPLGRTQSAFASSKGSVSACRGHDLVGTVTGGQSGAGNELSTIALTNVGIASCRLGGYPQLLGIRGGHEYRLRVTSRFTDPHLVPTILAPRESGAFVLNTTTGCIPGGDPHRASHLYSGVVLLLPDSRGPVRVRDVNLYTPCLLSESPLGWAKGFEFLLGP
jgi:hypothetical protein